MRVGILFVLEHCCYIPSAQDQAWHMEEYDKYLNEEVMEAGLREQQQGQRGQNLEKVRWDH
jgi:hypothetical protein